MAYVTVKNGLSPRSRKEAERKKRGCAECKRMRTTNTNRMGEREEGAPPHRYSLNGGRFCWDNGMVFRSPMSPGAAAAAESVAAAAAALAFIWMSGGSIRCCAAGLVGC